MDRLMVSRVFTQRSCDSLGIADIRLHKPGQLAATDRMFLGLRRCRIPEESRKASRCNLLSVSVRCVRTLKADAVLCILDPSSKLTLIRDPVESARLWCMVLWQHIQQDHWRKHCLYVSALLSTTEMNGNFASSQTKSEHAVH